MAPRGFIKQEAPRRITSNRAGEDGLVGGNRNTSSAVSTQRPVRDAGGRPAVPAGSFSSIRPGTPMQSPNVNLSNAASDVNELTQEEIDYINAGLNFGGGATAADIEAIVSKYVNRGSGGGGSSAANRQVALEEQRYQDELRQRELQRGGARQQYDFLTNAINNPANPFQGLLDQLAKQRTTAEADITAQYGSRLAELAGRRGEAVGRTDTGFTALDAFLAANQPAAYASAARATAPAGTNNIVQQFAQRLGAPTTQIQDEAQAQQVAAEGSASNFNNLLNLLAAQETSGAASRASEAAQSRAFSQGQLEALYGGATSGLERDRAAAISEALRQISGQEFSVEQARQARNQQLQDALLQLLASGNIPRA
jgi:hypothetical protein